MSNKGYPSTQKTDRTSPQHATLEPIRKNQFGLTVNGHIAVRGVGADVVEAGSTTTVINATAHIAEVGDVIRFTSGTHDGREVKVWAVDANTITIAEDLESAPAAAVTFDILRPKYLKVSSDGSLSTSSGPTQFVLDGVDTEVSEDTGTPALSNPFPVKILDGTGVEAGVAAQPLHVRLPSATETVLASILTSVDGLEALVTSTNSFVDGLEALIAATNGLVDGLEGYTDGLETALTAVNASLDQLEIIEASNNAYLANIDAGIPAGLGQATMANSMPVVIASNQGALPISVASNLEVNLNDGDGQTLESISNSASRGLYVSQLSRNAVGKARNDYSSVNVTTGAYVQLISSTAGNINEIEIFDSSGQTLVLALGGSGSEVDQIYIFPGGNGRVPLRIPIATRVSIKAVSATASAGEIVINFYS